MKFLKPSLVTLAFASGMLVFAACGRGGSASHRFAITESEPVTNDELLGVWNSGCLPVDGDVGYGAGSRLFRLQFDFSGVAVLKEYAYFDAACRNRIFDNTGEGRYQLTDRGRAVSFNFNTQIVLPLTEQGAQAMNDAHFCNSTTWRVNTYRDVRNASCIRTNVSKNDLGIIETRDLLIRLCAARVSSKLECESITFKSEGTRGESPGLDLLDE